MELLKRKIDQYLIEWKNNKNKKPLIVKGARQIGKTESIRNFAKTNYKNVIEINFVLQKQFKDIFDDGFEVDTIIKNISTRIHAKRNTNIFRRNPRLHKLCNIIKSIQRRWKI